MKQILALLILIPALANSQECRIKTETDRFSQEKKLNTGFIKLQDMTVSMIGDSKEVKFLFSLKDQCFRDTSTAMIFFDGKSGKSNYKNGSSMNCEGIFSFIFRNTPTTPSALQKLSTQKISSIRFRNSAGKLVEMNFTEEEKTKFMHAAACIIAEAKTLLKN